MHIKVTVYTPTGYRLYYNCWQQIKIQHTLTMSFKPYSRQK